MMSEKEYKKKLRGMYKRAAQKSLRMSQRFSTENIQNLGTKKGYNRALYPSVTQIANYESQRTQGSNQRYGERDDVLIKSKNLNDESLFEMINEIDHCYEANREDSREQSQNYS